MAETLLDVLSALLLLAGGGFAVLGGIGLVRFPDFYSRLHPAGITDTLATLLIVTGLVIQVGISMVAIKLLLILLFMIFTSPTASHALARAGLVAGRVPFQREASASEGARPSKP